MRRDILTGALALFAAVALPGCELNKLRIDVTRGTTPVLVGPVLTVEGEPGLEDMERLRRFDASIKFLGMGAGEAGKTIGQDGRVYDYTKSTSASETTSTVSSALERSMSGVDADFLYVDDVEAGAWGNMLLFIGIFRQWVSIEGDSATLSRASEGGAR